MRTLLFCSALALALGACGDDDNSDIDASPGTTANGLSCGANEDCQSLHCQNGFCCENGNCCASASDCPGSGGAPTCDDEANCQGSRTAPSCEDFSCKTSTVADDSACDETITAKTCSPYPDQTCNGLKAQATPVCTTSCSLESECADGYHCDETCQADLADGMSCDEGTDCASQFCNSGTCCTPGTNCCTTGADCEAFDTASSCDVADTCTGSVGVGTCTDHICETVEISDPTACDTQSCAGGGTCNASGACIPPS